MSAGISFVLLKKPAIQVTTAEMSIFKDGNQEK